LLRLSASSLLSSVYHCKDLFSVRTPNMALIPNTPITKIPDIRQPTYQTPTLSLTL
jgi:hypothetical protein